MADQEFDPQLARKANRLGLLLGVACLALVAAFFIIFTINGFPKDPAEYRRLLNRQQTLPGQGATDGQPGRAGEQRPGDQRPADQHRGLPDER